MKNNQIAGYVAGIVTGVTYGLNPLFAVPLMNAGANVESILFFRYSLAVVLLGLWLLIRKQSFKISGRQAVRLLILGLLFTASSLCLFEAYKYIPSGLATTIVFLYPVLVALIMVFLRVYPTWQVWSICPCICHVHRDSEPEHQDKEHPKHCPYILFAFSRVCCVLCYGGV